MALKEAAAQAKTAESRVITEKEQMREQLMAAESAKLDFEAKVRFLHRQDADLKEAFDKVRMMFWRFKRVSSLEDLISRGLFIVGEWLSVASI